MRADKWLLSAWVIALTAVIILGIWIVSGGPPQGPTQEEAQFTEPTSQTLSLSPDTSKNHQAITTPAPATKEQPVSIDAEQQTAPASAQSSDTQSSPTALQQAEIAKVDYGEGPRIAIIVHSLGLRESTTHQAITELPPEITLAFSPYGKNLDKWAQLARDYGHEYLLMVPMEPLRYPANNPGPDTLLKDDPPDRNITRLASVLSRMDGYVGVMNDMGSAFTANEEAMRPILEELHTAGLLFLDARSTNFSIASSLSKKLGINTAYNNRYLDQKPSREAINAVLDKLEEISITNGASLGLARPLPVSIEALKMWSKNITTQGQMTLVPVSAIANRQPIR